MGERICSCLAALGLYVLSSMLPAHAGVIYRWINVTADQDAGPIDAYIEFGTEFWQPGKTLQVTDRYSDPAALEAYFGVESFYFALLEDPGFPPIRITSDATCADYADSTRRFCPPDLSLDTRVAILNSGDVSTFTFDLILGPRLTGFISANNGSSDFRMQSMGSLFTLTRLGSDGGDCFRAGLCDGGTGYFELDASTIPTGEVPAPVTSVLWLIGSFALYWARRRAPRLDEI